ncbi:hypothetical protein ACGFIF_44220 [Kribbella sp. NPDC049174]|uniref:hypothetical protein n=1 Tax=Kribbella sp. NPDC049174 TaxID=3364112 RepID=UPI00371FAB2E
MFFDLGGHDAPFCLRAVAPVGLHLYDVGLAVLDLDEVGVVGAELGEPLVAQLGRAVHDLGDPVERKAFEGRKHLLLECLCPRVEYRGRLSAGVVIGGFAGRLRGAVAVFKVLGDLGGVESFELVGDSRRCPAGHAVQGAPLARQARVRGGVTPSSPGATLVGTTTHPREPARRCPRISQRPR